MSLFLILIFLENWVSQSVGQWLFLALHTVNLILHRVFHPLLLTFSIGSLELADLLGFMILSRSPI